MSENIFPLYHLNLLHSSSKQINVCADLSGLPVGDLQGTWLCLASKAFLAHKG